MELLLEDWLLPRPNVPQLDKTFASYSMDGKSYIVKPPTSIAFFF